jgi:LuxR family maltose regulon positive regulatory protein
VNTLKFHLRLVYRKLGVASRAEAAEVARGMASPGRSHVSPMVARR